MDRQQVQQLLIEVLTEIQTKSGQPRVALHERTCPIGGLPGFDSLTALEATVELAHQLGLSLSDENLFVNAPGTRALCIQEITERLSTMRTPKGASHDRADA